MNTFIPTFSPGVSWYAKKVQEGQPFSLVKYGGGEWLAIVPGLPEWRKRTSPNPKPISPVQKIWRSPEGKRALVEHFLATPRAENYYPAIFCQQGLKNRKWLPGIKTFLDKNGLDDLPWHDGNVWQDAVKEDRMNRMVIALRSQPLPVVLVGPDFLSLLEGYIPVEEHIETHMALDPNVDLEPLKEQVLASPRPAIFCFSCSAVGKMLIQEFYPLLGQESFLIDFGSAWDGYCGHKSRGYHKSLTPERVKLALEGR